LIWQVDTEVGRIYNTRIAGLLERRIRYIDLRISDLLDNIGWIYNPRITDLLDKAD
jgi:hypothetical protein